MHLQRTDLQLESVWQWPQQVFTHKEQRKGSATKPQFQSIIQQCINQKLLCFVVGTRKNLQADGLRLRDTHHRRLDMLKEADGPRGYLDVTCVC